MRISVVVPAYNRADLIFETLNRILAQSYSAFEIVVVNDGSTDDTAICVTAMSDRIRLITIANSGELVARNVGIGACAGDLVAFCDSDDLWQPDHLADMVLFWSGGRGPVAAFSDFREVREGGWAANGKFQSAPSNYWSDLERIGPEHFMFDRPIVRDLLVFQPFFPSCMVVHRERFLELGGWDERVSRIVGCDFATTLRIAERPPIGVLRRATVGIRKHAGNFSGDVLRMNLGDADVLAHVLATRPTLSAYAGEIGRSIEARRLAALDTAFASGNFEAVVAIVDMLSGDPSLSRRLKTLVARLPEPMRGVAWRLLTRIGTVRSSG